MDTIVSDNPIEVEGKIVKTFDEFWAEATSDDGLDLQGELFIDVDCLPDEDTYDNLKSTGIPIKWITVSGECPRWFDDDLIPIAEDNSEEELDDESMYILDQALSMIDTTPDQYTSGEPTFGRVVTFGSSKGGAGKTFTALISAKYYAQDHPNQRVAVLDLDIEEPQISAAIQVKNAPTVRKFWADYLAGDTSFAAMSKCKVNCDFMPPNLDFYLSPRDAHVIVDNDFWETCMYNLFSNYDMVVLDTGTSYMTLPPIISAYKVADKINLVCSAAITSSVAVATQIKRLIGRELPNDIYSPEDGLENKIHLIVTNTYDDSICKTIKEKMEEHAPIIAEFGILTPKINQIQILRRWYLFDDNPTFRQGMRDIMA